ncbi:MAG: ATP-dependent DNA helicase RecG, partial [Bifidobacteriaceae bacterium]|nr:ATP-dependent DNA helicase RecG [Bifidobacteriaceae bacterium]
ARDIKQRTQGLVSARISDGAHELELTFFLKKRHLVDFYTSQYRVGRMGLFTGKVSLYRGRQQLVHPEVVWDDALAGEDPRFAGHLIPIYPAVAGVQSPQLQKAIRTALTALGDETPSDPLPGTVLADRDLPGLGQAWWGIHNPAEPSQWRAARRRFRFEEAFVLQTGLARRRHQLETAAAARPRPLSAGAGSRVARLDAALPFRLTEAQRQAGDKLSRLLALERPMNQLLQGDVGSGKTVVALRAMLQVADAAGQAALLAPTEVLAAQHHQTITRLLAPLGSSAAAEKGPAGQTGPTTAGWAVEGGASEAGAGGFGGAAVGESGVGVRLLTGATSAKARASLLAEVSQGRVQIVVGTHALLEESVRFADLGLVVVDEQNRFGVEQRDALRSRAGDKPHLLVMTATPIPRTVAMTVFGDLGLTTLGQGPPGRPEVTTTWVNPREHPSWLARIWRRLAEEVAAGRRGLVVCPAIEPGELEADAELIGEDDGPRQGQLAFPAPVAAAAAPPPGHERALTTGSELAAGWLIGPGGGSGSRPVTGAGAAGGPDHCSDRGPEKKPLASVSQTVAELRANPALSGVRLAALHGRMPSQDKDRVMAAFSRGEIDVLVATTVIEVGIDVPEATALVVLDADRFGLSQLHQLRGRIGRGRDPGVCLLVSAAEPDSPAARRLTAMTQTRDGFALAEVDLATRREGEILGDSQSGHSSLKMVRLTSDQELIAQARAAAEVIVTEDPGLAGHPALARAVDALLAGRDDYLERG